MAIRDWPAAERPRERLLLQGAAALSDAELLAIFLRVGIPGKSAVDLARDLLHQFNGNLAELTAVHASKLAKSPGIGPAKAAQLSAALELARRSLISPLKERDVLSSPQAVRDWLRLSLGGLAHEVFFALWLDAQNRLLLTEELFRGTLTQTSVYPREVVKKALANNAGAVILAHNHPSGLAEPSSADITLTATLKQALGLIDVKVLDHFVVVSGGVPLSFAERGLI
ncbi:MAG: DNA repair protein RadC [Rugosibacter sp.]|jgi:DNA repair protein RadC|nr:DNA repair protein RadC [Rugosibacter sp.]